MLQDEVAKDDALSQELFMSDADRAKILVVDDLAEKLFTYRAILEDLGQDVYTACGGSEALRLVLQHDFAVVLLDVNMPDIDGFETAAMIRSRARSQHTPIIFLTAYADEMRIEEAYTNGAVDFILTPVVPEVLRAKVRVFVDLFQLTAKIQRQAQEQMVLVQERLRRAAAEEANSRLAFLARAGAVLGQSLDPSVCARDALQLAVPALADSALIVQRGAGNTRCLRARQVVGEITFDELPCDAAIPPEFAGLTEHVVRHAEPFGQLQGEPCPCDEDPDVLAFPLQGNRSEITGVMIISRAHTGSHFAAGEVAICEAFASRCAIAMENARLFCEVEQANRQKNEFLSMLAHELRNPLAPIRNAISVLRLPGITRANSEWAQDVIDRQVHHLVRLVDDLLDVSRITSGKIRLEFERFDLLRALNNAVETSAPLIQAAGHRFEPALPLDPIWVEGDHARLSQVFANLLNNAAKYTPQGGAIWLTAHATSDRVVVQVRDTGIGISAEMLPRVFELFSQADQSLDRSQGGLGIGLTVVQRLVTMHGGSVQAASPGSNKGSTFTVTLPIVSAPIAQRQAAMDGERRNLGRSWRMLVVDDNRDTADTLATLLRLEGHEVLTAYDGNEAITAAIEFRPQACILDLGLPGMSGFDIARQLRFGGGVDEPLLVAVSGYGQQEDQRRSREAGFHYHFTKPVDHYRLLGLLSSLPQPERA